MMNLSNGADDKLINYINKFEEVLACFSYKIKAGFAVLTFDDKEIDVTKEKKIIDQILKTHNNSTNLINLLKAPLTLQMDVVKKGELLFCRDKILLADYKEQLIRRYCDFEPDLKEFLRDYDVGLREDSNG